jgi:LacI family sucrose operon transcriptional repressor
VIMATIKDVAKYAGVSVATVSRVLNKKEPLTEKTIKKVEDAIEALGYYPNMYARTLVGGKNDILGVILSSFNNPFFAELAQELEAAAKAREYNILFTAAGTDFNEKMAATEYLLSRQVDGIIFSSYVDPDKEAKIRERCKVPFVEMLHPLSDTYSVYSDDKQGGILAARHMYAKGCKKLVHISAQTTVYKYADERTYAFVRECANLGIDCRVYQNEYEVTNLAGIRELINRIFYENRDVDGMFLSNDILATQCLAYALSQGYRIPDDIRIMGYDGIYITSLVYPALTTVQQNFTKLAECAVDTAINLIEGKETPKEILIPVELIERKTT